MKRKASQKVNEQKTIDPAVLENILGGAQPDIGDATKATVISQPSFGSFYHS
jgi:hypothetical protein